MKDMLKSLIIFMIVGLAAFWLYMKNETTFKLPDAPVIDQTSPPCLQMYYLIDKYAEQYDIPRKYAYGIAYCETRYTNPFQWNYNHKQTSYAGAVGPMQVMMPTARMMWPKRKFTKADLKDNIQFNVETSMKLLRYLHNRYGNWKLVFGAYNTGRPMVNQYALNVYNYNLKF
jgi:soluble lytic murein transglycosylase-like protein